MTESAQEQYCVLIHVANHKHIHAVGELLFMLTSKEEVRWFDDAKDARLAAREYELRHRDLVQCYVTMRSCL